MDLPLTSLAGGLLLIATILSVGYELWRAVARSGVGPNDDLRSWVTGLPLYIGATIASVLLLAGWEYASIVGLAFAMLACLASIFWYGPTILLARRPGMFDWFEDRVFTMLVAIVAVLLVCDLLGVSLVA
jgi:hypothetical protein